MNGKLWLVKNMESRILKPVKPIHKPKRKRRSRFAQMEILRRMSREIRDRDKYGIGIDELRFRRRGSRMLYEFVLPEGSRVVNGLVFVDAQGGKVECLGTVNQYIMGGLEK